MQARCAGALFAGDSTVEVLSVTKLPFPAYGVRTEAMRVTYDLTTAGDTIRQIDDAVTVSLRRTVISLWLMTNAASKAAADSIERDLMWLLALRATR